MFDIAGVHEYLRSAVRSVLRCAPCQCDEGYIDFHAEWQAQCQEKAKSGLLVMVFLSGAVVLGFAVLRGFASYVDLFFLTQSIIDFILVLIGWICMRYLRWGLRVVDVLFFIALPHSIFHNHLNCTRAITMMSWFVEEVEADVANGCAFDHGAEYGMLLNMALLSVVLHIMNVRLKTFSVALCAPVVWSVQISTLGTSLDSRVAVKYGFLYSVLCLSVVFAARKAYFAERSHFVRSLAEKVLIVRKMSVREENAMHSFVAAVFDVFGHLSWATPNEFDEPRLCFEDIPNPALDDFLSMYAAGKPVEALLGREPTDRGDRHNFWFSERERLLTYANAEAREHDLTDTAPARKIGITFHESDSSQEPTELELFIHASSGDKVLFGILVLKQPARHPALRAESTDDTVLRLRPDSGDGPASLKSALSSGGSLGSLRSEAMTPLPLWDSREAGEAAEVSVWVDFLAELPLLCATAGFTLLTGPAPRSAPLRDMLADPQAFLEWLQGELTPIVDAQEEENIVQSSISDELEKTPRSFTHGTALRTMLRGVGMCNSRIEVQAMCTVDLDKSANPSTYMPNYEQGTMPVCITFQDIQPVRLRRIPKKPPRKASGHAMNPQLSLFRIDYTDESRKSRSPKHDLLEL